MRSLLRSVMELSCQKEKAVLIKGLLPYCSAAGICQGQTLNSCQELLVHYNVVFFKSFYWQYYKRLLSVHLFSSVTTTFFFFSFECTLSFGFLIYILCVYFVCCFRTRLGLPESEACFLQGAGQGRLRGVVVEKERCKGLLFSEMEEILVCS